MSHKGTFISPFFTKKWATDVERNVTSHAKTKIVKLVLEDTHKCIKIYTTNKTNDQGLLEEHIYALKLCKMKLYKHECYKLCQVFVNCTKTYIF